jgi:hypothetical protein
VKRQRAPALVHTPLVFTRADKEALERFDTRTKICTMNCGPHRDDPRNHKERMFLCNDCQTNTDRND